MTHRRTKKLPKTIMAQLLLFIGVPIVAACLVFIYLYAFVRVRYDLPEPVAIITIAEKITEADTIIGKPVRLVIPEINIATTIAQVGLTSDGDMAVGDNPNTVWWYKAGPKPGEEGSAVIAGHYGWESGHGSIFNELHTLTPGDKLSVYDSKGTVIKFVVRESRSFNPNADATKVFKSTDKKAHLNLITCEGEWLSSRNSYSDRLVVFTDLE